VTALHLEPLLRVHLARFGTRDDLLAAIDSAERSAEDLLADADAVAREFVAGEHLFQGEAHVRGLLFDALVSQAQALRGWAERARAEVDGWPDLDGDAPSRERALERMRAYLTDRERA